MLLDIDNLIIDLAVPGGVKRVVRGVSLAIEAGQSLGVVGESGSGKTITALAVMGLLPEGAKVSGAIRFAGRDIARLAESEMRKLRGDRISMIFQEPMTALNPLIRVGDQVAEPLRLHRGLSRAQAGEAAVRLLARVQLRDPERLARAYPFALSGGERQRVMIAIALACGPQLVIADEPTTALDVTVQAKILDLLASLSAESGLAILLVSHDLAVIARHCRRVLVMYGGAAMEEGPVEAVLGKALHPYTRALLAARPKLGGPRGVRLAAIPGQATAAASEGCAFVERCPLALPVCRREPPAVTLEDGHVVRCVRVTPQGQLT
ncbi:MAG TPA: ABC transporter ATP-binding protein [Roseiarcus sp.]|nr:ABC transporter ATP-binding protein [Roseiarcus sp.]